MAGVKVLPDDADTSDMVFAGASVKAMPKPLVDSDQRRCDICHQMIWVDKRSVAHADACKKRICVDCLLVEINKADNETE